MSWSTTQVEKIVFDQFVPQTTATGVVLFLHGYDNITLKENRAYTEQLEKQSLIAICPLGPGCCWTNVANEDFHPQLSPVEFLARHVPAYCEQTWGITAPKIAVFGIEMGGQGALQLAYRHARTFPIVVAISPKVDFESWWGHGTTLDTIFPDREAARQQTATLHIHPLNYPKKQTLLCDPADQYCFDGVVTLASKLSSSGIPFDHDFVTSHGGYGWEYANFMARRVVELIATEIKG